VSEKAPESGQNPPKSDPKWSKSGQKVTLGRPWAVLGRPLGSLWAPRGGPPNALLKKTAKGQSMSRHFGQKGGPRGAQGRQNGTKMGAKYEKKTVHKKYTKKTRFRPIWDAFFNYFGVFFSA